jgi:hypothetical protein
MTWERFIPSSLIRSIGSLEFFAGAVCCAPIGQPLNVNARSKSAVANLHRVIWFSSDSKM